MPNEVESRMPSLGLIILILIVALPLLEIAVLIKAGAVLGVWATLGIVLGTAFLGVMVFRLQGPGVARRAFGQMRDGAPPLEPLIESGLLAFAGACLIAPGLITDTVGLLLLVPPLRRLLARTIASRGTVVVRRGKSRDGSPRGTDAGLTIDGDFERLGERELPDPKAPRDGRSPPG